MPIESVVRYINRKIPRPSAFQPRDAEKSVRVRKLLVTTRYPNPTFSYYFEQRIFNNPDKPIIVRGLKDPLTDIDPEGLFVVFCRYALARQVQWVRENRSKLAGVAIFIDDDLASILTGKQGTWYYKLFLAYYGVLPLPWLNPTISHVWASTDGLADALAKFGPRPDVLRPMPPPAQEKIAATGPRIRMAYHATNIHRQEHEFLVPIVKAALSRNPQLDFEVFANGRNARRWLSAGIDPKRLRVRHTLPWVRYVEATQQEHVDIGLVPLLEGPTNASRSDTKRIDLMRMGAAGIYQAGTIFDRCAVEGEIHVSSDPADWGRAIDLLVNDPALRAKARNATVRSIEVMRNQATSGFPGIVFEQLAAQTPQNANPAKQNNAGTQRQDEVGQALHVPD